MDVDRQEWHERNLAMWELLQWSHVLMDVDSLDSRMHPGASNRFNGATS